MLLLHTVDMSEIRLKTLWSVFFLTKISLNLIKKLLLLPILVLIKLEILDLCYGDDASKMHRRRVMLI